jgi:hypothetical protein
MTQPKLKAGRFRVARAPSAAGHYSATLPICPYVNSPLLQWLNPRGLDIRERLQG